jgi:CheY-like chemotaxis protein
MTRQALIVDDDKDVRLVWSALARDCGLETIEAIDGREAMKLLEKDEQFDLVVIDRMMPFVSGDEVLRHMRESARYKATPVILSTANRSTQALSDFTPDPLTWYVNKAAGIDKLRKAINSALVRET